MRTSEATVATSNESPRFFLGLLVRYLKLIETSNKMVLEKLGYWLGSRVTGCSNPDFD